MAVITYVRRTANALFMGVMLLWAFTMPGHEVVVYSYILSSISGKPADAALTESSSLAYNTGKANQHQVQAYLDADTATLRLLLQPGLGRPVSFYFNIFSGSNHHNYNRLAEQGNWLIRLLPISNLPNAP